MFTQNTYQDDIKPFNKISVSKATQLLSTDELIILYIGRETCPYCRKFAKKLSGLASQISVPIYYIDSSDDHDPDIDDFRENYVIITVPGFIVSKNGKVTVRCDSSLTENELLNMMK